MNRFDVDGGFDFGFDFGTDFEMHPHRVKRVKRNSVISYSVEMVRQRHSHLHMDLQTRCGADVNERMVSRVGR